MTTFASLGLADSILQTLSDLGYETPTPIQQQAIKPVLDGRDVLGSARTGTGKTAAFALPIIHHLLVNEPVEVIDDSPARPSRRGRQPGRRARALVMAPTRELAEQIDESFRTYARRTPVRTTAIFGGVSQRHQERALERGVDVIVATPGRLIDLVEQGVVDLRAIDFLVLDEADRMLDMGFIHPIRRICTELPEPRRTMMFSATMPSAIEQLSRELLSDPMRIEVDPVDTTAPLVEQSVCQVAGVQKQELLERILVLEDAERSVVFVRTKHSADRVCRHLRNAGIRAASIHGDKSQAQRRRALEDFRRGRDSVLVATDVAARGLDVDGISHVVNFDLPMEPESYIHRIGRTGRAGAVGCAISFCAPHERGLLRAIERMTGEPIAQMRVPDARIDAPRRAPIAAQGAAPSAPPAAPRRPRHDPGGNDSNWTPERGNDARRNGHDAPDHSHAWRRDRPERGGWQPRDGGGQRRDPRQDPRHADRQDARAGDRRPGQPRPDGPRRDPRQDRGQFDRRTVQQSPRGDQRRFDDRAGGPPSHRRDDRRPYDDRGRTERGAGDRRFDDRRSGERGFAGPGRDERGGHRHAHPSAHGRPQRGPSQHGGRSHDGGRGSRQHAGNDGPRASHPFAGRGAAGRDDPRGGDRPQGGRPHGKPGRHGARPEGRGNGRPGGRPGNRPHGRPNGRPSGRPAKRH